MSVSFECTGYEAEPDYQYYWPETIAAYHPDDEGAQSVFDPCDSNRIQQQEEYYWPEYVSYQNQILETLIALVEDCDRAPQTVEAFYPGLRMLPPIEKVVKEASPEELAQFVAAMAVQNGEDLCAMLPQCEEVAHETETLMRRYMRIARKFEAWLRKKMREKSERSQPRLELL